MVHLYPLKSSIFSAHFCARRETHHHGAPGGPAHARFATRRRVHAEARVGHARRGERVLFVFCLSFVRRGKSAFLFEFKSVSSLNWKCLNVRACIKVLT